MLCTTASCVRFRNNIGGCCYLDVVLMIYFMVVTSHDVFKYCWWLSLLFGLFSISSPLSRACLWLFTCIFLLVVASLGLFFSENKLCGFEVVLDGNFFVFIFFVNLNDTFWGDVPCDWIWRVVWVRHFETNHFDHCTWIKRPYLHGCCIFIGMKSAGCLGAQWYPIVWLSSGYVVSSWFLLVVWSQTI